VLRLCVMKNQSKLYIFVLIMDFLGTLCIFITILFLYIYIMNQFKISEDLDIYEMDFSNNTHLQEVCEIRQPVLFQFQNIHPKLFTDITPQSIAKYGSYDVRIKDAHDYYTENRAEHSQIDAVALSLHNSIKLLENDNAAHFFSENNDDFLDESGLLRTIRSMDDFLKPVFNVHTKYDLWFASPNAVTPLRYHTNYRQFICVTSGKIRVKMTPWKSSKYLHPVKDYENYEFRSPVHPTHPSEQYSNDFEKTKFLEFEVQEGYVLYIPPYWWYSIMYLGIPNTFVCSVSYNTIMNCISNAPDLWLYWLQQQNITKKITKIPSDRVQTNKEVEETIVVPNTQMETTIEKVEKEPQEVSEQQNVDDVETIFSTSILDELESTLVSEQKMDNAEVNVKDI
jgi:hypothetical protein